MLRRLVALLAILLGLLVILLAATAISVFGLNIGGAIAFVIIVGLLLLIDRD